MPDPTIFILRHGEKPKGDAPGIKPDGSHSPHSLTVKGWRRAGALPSLFGAAGHSHASAPLQVPATIFAASPKAKGADPKEKSKREKETATPLAAKLGLSLNLKFGKGLEVELAKAVRKSDGPVAIVWEHERIVELTKLFSDSKDIPAKWPSDRFDIVFVLTAVPGGYAFQQLPQLLLEDDSKSLIK